MSALVATTRHEGFKMSRCMERRGATALSMTHSSTGEGVFPHSCFSPQIGFRTRESRRTGGPEYPVQRADLGFLFLFEFSLGIQLNFVEKGAVSTTKHTMRNHLNRQKNDVRGCHWRKDLGREGVRDLMENPQHIIEFIL